MIKRLGTLAAAFAVASLVITVGPALAGQNTATLHVAGSVTQSCTAFTPASNTLTFSAYDSFANASTPVNAGPVSYTTQCTKNASGVTFQVDGGANYAHTSGTRAMKSTTASDWLNYALYSDAAHSSPWAFNSGTGAGTPGSALSISSSTATQTLTIYGQIPAGQDPSPATDYADTVTVAVNF